MSICLCLHVPMSPCFHVPHGSVSPCPHIPLVHVSMSLSMFPCARPCFYVVVYNSMSLSMLSWPRPCFNVLVHVSIPRPCFRVLVNVSLSSSMFLCPCPCFYVLFHVFMSSENGKRKFVFLVRQTINGNRQCFSKHTHPCSKSTQSDISHQVSQRGMIVIWISRRIPKIFEKYRIDSSWLSWCILFSHSALTQSAQVDCLDRESHCTLTRRARKK